MNHLTTVDRWSWAPRYLSISLKKDLWTPVVIKEIMASGSLYGLNSHLGNTVSAKIAMFVNINIIQSVKKKIVL